MKKILFFAIAIFALIPSLPMAEKLRVAVAANAQYAMKEVKLQYVKNMDTNCKNEQANS